MLEKKIASPTTRSSGEQTAFLDYKKQFFYPRSSDYRIFESAHVFGSTDMQ
jgi:hypothetical protein